MNLPQGTIDLGLDVPHEDVKIIGTKAMLAARADLKLRFAHRRLKLKLRARNQLAPRSISNIVRIWIIA